MDFSFTEDQLLIAETADSFLDDVSKSADIRAAMITGRGYDDALWQRITSEMGWQLTHIPEAFDGLGLGYVELAILFERMGKHLLCAPFYSSVALGVNALLCAGTDEQKKALLPRVANEGLRVSLAYADNSRRWGLESISATYEKTPTGVIVDGDYSYVIDGHTADFLVVAARDAANAQSDSAIGLFIVPTNDAGIETQLTPGMDQTRKLARVTLDKVAVAEQWLMQDCGKAGQHLESALALASIALAAEQLGVADQALSLTVEYIKERNQFGRAVGSFQSMKHKAADMMNKAEAARSAVYYAACIADEFLSGNVNDLGAELLEAASIAKAYCCEAAFYNSGMAIQMHGGVGFTWEYDIHLFFKRAKAAQLSLGDSAWHKEKIAQAILGESS